MALGLARRGWSVTYACPGYLHRRAQTVESGLALPESLRVVQPPALPGASRLEMIGTLNRWLMRRELRSLSSGPWDVVIYNAPHLSPLAARLPARFRVFDYMDDLSAMMPTQSRSGSPEETALGVADRVWTGTASLADRIAGRHDHVRFIPCGVDADRFAHPETAQLEKARGDLPAGQGPVAGYFGVLNERFDMERVQALMRSGPWRVLLIGPTSSRAPALPDHPQLRWIGPRPYAELPAYLGCFDLALIPYDTRGPHRFLYPVKALEYLAGAIPVLSTPLPDVVRFLGDFVELADSAENWFATGRRLLSELGPAQERARLGQAYAQSRSWDAMIDEMREDLAQIRP